MAKRHGTKVLVYLVLTGLSTVALFAVSARSGEFNKHLIDVAKERISESFVLETIWLNALILCVVSLSFLFRWLVNRRRSPDASIAKHQSDREGSVSQELLSEMPRTLYLLGAVMSSVFYVVALRQIQEASDWNRAAGFAGYGFMLTFVLGAWGHFVEVAISTSWERAWKSVALVAAVVVLALIALPVSLPIALLAFDVFSSRLGLNKKT